MTQIDWPSVGIIIAIVLILVSVPRYIRWEENRRDRKEILQRYKEAQDAFEAGLITKYPATLTPEEVAFFNGPAYR